jgi:hypothetical protein
MVTSEEKGNFLTRTFLWNSNEGQKREGHSPTVQIFKTVMLSKTNAASVLFTSGYKNVFIKLECDSS